MTDNEKENVDAFYAEYYIYMRVSQDKVLNTDTIVQESEVPSGKHTID